LAEENGGDRALRAARLPGTSSATSACDINPDWQPLDDDDDDDNGGDDDD
jgi:hypothetical protein